MEEFRPLISGVVGAVVSVALLAWAIKDSHSPSIAGAARYGWRARALVLGASILGLFIFYVAMQASKDQRAIAWTLAGISLAFAILAPLEVFVTRFVAQVDGLQIRSAWRGTRLIPWQALGQCHYRPALEAHEVVTRGFGKLYISKYLVGLDQLLAAIRHRGNPRAS
jgi:hypothetical protein